MIQQEDTLDQLFADAAERAAGPLWTQMSTMVPPRPAPKATPHIWRWAQLRPLLARAGRLVSEREAERRVFMLVNPSLRAPYTTDTLFAGLQLINPGEVARAHRHVAFALRFIVEGERGYSAVGGEKVTMERGDFVITPSWTWHDHGHEGDRPMVWLDGLDLPMFQALPVNFAEPYVEARYPSEPAGPASILRRPWSVMAEQLAAIDAPFASSPYLSASGGPISRIIGASAERLAGGFGSGVRCSTASYVYHVYEGTGSTRIGEQTLAWERGDTFAIPAWMPFEHQARGADSAFLFRFDDRPMLESLGYYREASRG